MKIKSITIKNFRGYKDPVTIQVNDMTVFVGPNDFGKSTILEALDIFFNDTKGVIQIDKNDVNVSCREAGDLETIISVTFTNLPGKIVLDESPETTLASEFLLDRDGNFTVVKKYNDAGRLKIFVKALHPSNENCKNLLTLKIADLKKILDGNGITKCADKTKKVSIRQSIWNHFCDDLKLEEQLLETSGDGLKDIWQKISDYMPIYSLFQSDRSNSDKDKEAQDPIKEAVKQVLADEDVKSQLNDVAKRVIEYLKNVTDATLDKLKLLNPNVADSLTANIPQVDSLKWSDVFKTVEMHGNDDIPMNKRGSGVRRLLLLSFFQAQAEKKLRKNNQSNVIYGIEEPETSQHYVHQKLLIDALNNLVSDPESKSQVLMTTHSPFMVKQTKIENLRLIVNNDDAKDVKNVENNLLPYTSLNEINYSAFGEISEEYHNELFGILQDKATEEDASNGRLEGFDNWLCTQGCDKTKEWIKVRHSGQINQQVTLQQYVRNCIHHPENSLNVRFTEEELKLSIDKMRSILHNYNLR